jgi:hypothetical protein
VLQAEDGDRQIGAWLKWPADAPLLDKPMGTVLADAVFGERALLEVRRRGWA